MSASSYHRIQRFKVCTYIDSIDQVLGLIYGDFPKDSSLDMVTMIILKAVKKGNTRD
jgi:hypothetical protein